MFFPRKLGTVSGSTSGAAGSEAAAAKGSSPEKKKQASPATKADGPPSPEGSQDGGPNDSSPASKAAGNEPGSIEIVAQDAEGKPLSGAAFRVDVASGKPVEGKLDAQGYAKVEGVGKKACVVSFPGLKFD